MNSFDAEEQVIGGILIENANLKWVLATGLDGADFSDHCLAQLWEYIIEMTDENLHIDALTTRDYINSQGNHSGKWTSFPYLASLMENCIGTANIEVYANHIRDTRINNDIDKLKQSIKYDNYQQTVTDIQKLELDLAKDEEGSMLNIVSKTVEYIDDMRENGTGLSTGFDSIDSLLGGMRGGTLTVMAGRPSMGKSTLALNIANNMATRNKNVLFYSLEMQQVQLMMKIVASETDINLNKVDNDTLSEDENNRWYKALAKAGDKTMTILDRGNIAVRDIVSKARQIHGQTGIDCIVIDYLQIMKYDKNREISELGNITRELKYLSKELDIPIILLSQLSRGVEQRENKRPLMSDLRSSGEIEQDADCIIMVYRDEYYNKEESEDRGMAEIIVAKNRMGQIGWVKCKFEGQYSKFSDEERNLYNKE
jgi:replicative DNA helicase